MIEFKDTNHCISCTSKRKKFVFKYSGFKSIVFKCFKCVDCDLLYSSPQPIINIDSLNEIYNGEYYKNYFGRDNDYTVEKSTTNEIINQRLSKEFKYFSSFLDQLDDNKKVLDIGCGDGRFLELFEKLDWNCFGIEPSKFVAKIASKRKITILQKSVLELSESNKFDFIFLDNVIEHLDYPAKYLEKIYKLLNPSSVFVLKTPNSDGLVERTETFILSLLSEKFIDWLMKILYEKLNIGSGKIHRYGNLHPPVHLSIFNKESITKALIKAGFNENDLTVVSGSEYYHQWRVKRPSKKGFFNKILKFMKIAGDFIKKGEMLVVVAKKSSTIDKKKRGLV